MPVLQDLLSGLVAGQVQVVDLTQELSAETPVIQLPPPFAQTAPFRAEPIAEYDERCPTCYWNNIHLGEHTGTHMDAPAHWLSGRHLPDGFTDTMDARRFVAPACVIDCTAEVARSETYLLTPDDVMRWEAEHGRIPAGAWVLMRTGWSKRVRSPGFLNEREDGPHTPGASVETIRLLVERQVNGLGVETVGTDAGLAMGFDPPFPFHEIGLGANLLGLSSLANLHLLPPVGSILIAAPLKMKRGSGSPVRVLALVNRPA